MAATLIFFAAFDIFISDIFAFLLLSADYCFRHSAITLAPPLAFATPAAYAD